MVETTLCYIEHEGCYLMLYRNKKDKDFNKGKWIGVGGHVEQGETITECLIREVKEETGLTLTEYTKKGVIDFYSDTWENEVMHLYTATAFSGELACDCDEGTLKWVPMDEILGLKLWEGDVIFLKKLLANEQDIRLKLRYEGDKLVEVKDFMSMDIKKKIVDIAEKLNTNYKEQDIFEMGIGEHLPKRAEIIEILDEIRRAVFPGYFGTENTSYVSLESFAANRIAVIYEKLFKQIRIALSYKNERTDDTAVINEAEKITFAFLDRLPHVQNLIYKDVEAELSGDPAANSREEIIFSYPGIFAIFVYRIAHELYLLNVPFIPRIMTEHAHGKTGIDINPGAAIGEYFFIDHGTGIVIGETTIIGNNVKLYQGVTLGALSTKEGQALSGVKRHPTIEDNVVIYANTTVLGGETVVGKNSVVAGNSFITESIPPNTKVSVHIPELKMKSRE